MARSLITGISGQDGQLLAGELRACGREVIGTSSRSGVGSAHRLDCGDARAVGELLDSIQPDEIYHLGCPSRLEDTREFERAVFASSVDATLEMLRWIRDKKPRARFFFAGSSEIFGDPVESPQSETTPERPQHVYAVAKCAGRQLCEVFRGLGVFACAGILYNHESPLRRPDFVTRRITQKVAEISLGLADKLVLGNLDAQRDWSAASDFVRGFRLALEATAPDDYVFASGVSRTVGDFVAEAFASAGLDAAGRVVSDQTLFRGDFARPRCGDASRARGRLGWVAERPFANWVREMVLADVKALRDAP